MFASIACLEHPSLVDLRFSSLLGLEIKPWLSMHMLDLVALVACHSIGAPILIICCILRVLSLTILKVAFH